MNRIIIIGNGLDLAHDLETSYSSFLRSLLSDSIRESTRSDYENALFNIKREVLFNFVQKEYQDLSLRENDINKLIERMINHDRLEEVVSSKSPFASDLLKCVSTKRWADLEYIYFHHLRLYASDQNKGELNANCIDTINDQWLYLKNRFFAYMSKLSMKCYKNSKFDEIFHEPFKNLADKSNDSIDLLQDHSIGNYYYLNFNYTTVYRDYVRNLDNCIDIHGLLNEGVDSLVFGWGDDMHSSYSRIEDLNDNRYMKFTKSFDYLKSNRYHTLMALIEQNYEVYIVGHSCGLSDRTMLQSIFNSPKCKQIKIFYYDRNDGTTDFTEKTIEISRHCPNKSGLRRKIVSFGESRSM